MCFKRTNPHNKKGFKCGSSELCPTCLHAQRALNKKHKDMNDNKIKEKCPACTGTGNIHKNCIMR